jgi:NitT/TauT family transport system substrate-binding protein
MRLVPGGTGATRSSGVIRRSGLAAIVASSALLLASCHMPGTSSGQAAAKGQLTVAVVAGPDTAPLQVALRQGLFTQQGLQVTVHTYPTLKQAYLSLTSGKAAIVAGDYADLFYQVAHGMGPRLRLVADGYDATPDTMEVLTLPPGTKIPGKPPAHITSPQQLVGQAVATPFAQLAPNSKTHPYNIETLATESVLQGDGVSPSSVHWLQMSPGRMIRALRVGTVQAIVVPEPYVLQAETALGAVELLDSFSGVTASLPMSGYFTTLTYAKQHATALRAFRSGLARAQQAAAQRGAVQTVLAGQPGMNANFASLVDLGQYPTFLSVGQVQRVADLMYDSGMVTSTISVRNLVFR